MLKLRNKQIELIGTDSSGRLREFLCSSFPEAKEIPKEEMNEQLMKLTERSKKYGLYLETQVAPFVVCAWLMGLEFDEQYGVVRKTLNDPILSSAEKTEFLWQFVEKSFQTLEG